MLSHERFLELACADAARCRSNNFVPDPIAHRSDNCFFASWITEGMREGMNPGPVEVEPEPEIEPLLELLDDLGLKRRQVNEIKALLVHDTDRETLDYDGSWRMLAFKTITIEALHGCLVGYGVVAPAPGSPA